MLKKLACFILFGNYFLGLCIVALSIETAVKNGFFLTNFSYYLFVFLTTVVYYTYAYMGDGNVKHTSNPRSQWYARNRQMIRRTQVVFSIIICIIVIYWCIEYYQSLLLLTVSNWLLPALFPFVALLYYGVIFPARFRFRLRNIAWLKPFIIGFVCTGVIAVYPLLFYALQKQTAFHLSLLQVWYFFTNWLFTSVIAIMFDIKDFAADHNYRLKTFVVTKGLRRTIFFVLFPMAAASFAFFLVFAAARHFSLLQIIINAIPFLLLLAAAASLQRRKKILYYLAVIDGLLLIKAVFGIGAILLVM